jgi:hypothetical protein
VAREIVAAYETFEFFEYPVVPLGTTMGSIIADAALAVAEPEIRQDMLTYLIDKAKHAKGVLVMYDGEGRDFDLTLTEWLELYLSIEREEDHD